MQVIRKLAGCDDGTCPAIWGTDDPEVIAVRGAIVLNLAAAGVADTPDHEGVVLIPRSMLTQAQAALEDG